MLTVVREATLLFNQEYIHHADTISRIQQRMINDIRQMKLEPTELKDALNYAKDDGNRIKHCNG